MWTYECINILEQSWRGVCVCVCELIGCKYLLSILGVQSACKFQNLRKITIFLNLSVQLLSRVWPFATHGLQHARPPCASPTPGVYSNSCPLSWWCYPTISSSIVPFSSCPQSFPASGSFQMSQLFTSGHSIEVSASASVLPVNIQDWSLLGWTGWISF